MTPEDLEVRLRLLEIASKVQESIAFAFAVTLDEETRLDLIQSLQVIQLSNAAKGETDAASGMQYFIERLLAVSEPGSASPLLTLAMEGALYAQAKPDQKASLQSWLGIASPEEIADDLREALKPKPPLRAVHGKRRKPGGDDLV